MAVVIAPIWVMPRELGKGSRVMVGGRPVIVEVVTQNLEGGFTLDLGHCGVLHFGAGERVPVLREVRVGTAASVAQADRWVLPGTVDQVSEGGRIWVRLDRAVGPHMFVPNPTGSRLLFVVEDYRLARSFPEALCVLGYRAVATPKPLF